MNRAMASSCVTSSPSAAGARASHAFSGYTRSLAGSAEADSANTTTQASPITLHPPFRCHQPIPSPVVRPTRRPPIIPLLPMNPIYVHALRTVYCRGFSANLYPCPRPGRPSSTFGQFRSAVDIPCKPLVKRHGGRIHVPICIPALPSVVVCGSTGCYTLGGGARVRSGRL